LSAKDYAKLTILIQDFINGLINQRFDKAAEAQQIDVSKPDPAETSTFQTTSQNTKSTSNGTSTTNGVGHATHGESKNNDSSNRKRATSGSTDDAEGDFSDVMTPSPPPKKKHKKMLSTDNDAAIARRLQEMENAGARSTRGGGTKRKPLIKKDKKIKKSKTKVASDDDSDAEGGSGSKKEVNRNTGFHVSATLRYRNPDPDRPIPSAEIDEDANPEFCWSQADQTNHRVEPKWRLQKPGIGYKGGAKQNSNWRNSRDTLQPPEFVKKRSINDDF